jgi:hypothetical protein
LYIGIVRTSDHAQEPRQLGVFTSLKIRCEAYVVVQYIYTVTPWSQYRGLDSIAKVYLPTQQALRLQQSVAHQTRANSDLRPKLARVYHPIISGSSPVTSTTSNQNQAKSLRVYPLNYQLKPDYQSFIVTTQELRSGK